jgi:putative transposase
VSESANRTILSQAGIIVESEWKRTETIRDNVILDEYVVMPNHFHAILIITESNKKSQPTEQISQDTLREIKATELYKNKFGPQRNNLSSMVGGFKAAVTSAIRYDLGLSFSWQDGFYEHIIRNEKVLEKVREYIFYNPLKWKWDKYYR